MIHAAIAKTLMPANRNAALLKSRFATACDAANSVNTTKAMRETTAAEASASVTGVTLPGADLLGNLPFFWADAIKKAGVWGHTYRTKPRKCQ